MLKDLFRKPKYVTVHADTAKKDIPEGLWQKCPNCNEILYAKKLETSGRLCEKCGYHFRVPARERINMILDEGSFQEINAGLVPVNPLESAGYPEKVALAQDAAGIKEAVITGEGTVEGNPLVIAVMDAHFIMGSMGSVVGEKIARAIEHAIEKRLPVVIFAASGGARMQEGILSLMQMAKTSGTLTRLADAGLLYVSVLTDPTTGGVTASFASLGDIILAEPGALIGFTGPRVIEQTIKQKLPEGFQTAEFMLQHGYVDRVVKRPDLRPTLARILNLHYAGALPGKGGEAGA
jgi:acetyl-CoA carboxylase carboxyl transferase subunit beta